MAQLYLIKIKFTSKENEDPRYQLKGALESVAFDYNASRNQLSSHG